MSGKDRDRLKVLHEVRKRHITQQQAGAELGISSRWVRALLKRMKFEGDRAVVHRLQGRPSNRKLPAWMKQCALMLFRQHKQAKQWHDYGTTLAVGTGDRAWVEGRQRDAAEMAHRGGVVEGATGAGGTDAQLAGAPCPLGRTAAVGHQRTRLAGRAQFTTGSKPTITADFWQTTTSRMTPVLSFSQPEH